MLAKQIPKRMLSLEIQWNCLIFMEVEYSLSSILINYYQLATSLLNNIVISNM